MTSTDSTTSICPSWCTKEPGHDLPAMTALDPLRFHERGFGELAGGVEVNLSQIETMSPDAAPAPVTIEVWARDDLTGPEASQVAAALLDAADAWDKARGGQR